MTDQATDVFAKKYEFTSDDCRHLARRVRMLAEADRDVNLDLLAYQTLTGLTWRLSEAWDVDATGEALIVLVREYPASWVEEDLEKCALIEPPEIRRLPRLTSDVQVLIDMLGSGPLSAWDFEVRKFAGFSHAGVALAHNAFRVRYAPSVAIGLLSCMLEAYEYLAREFEGMNKIKEAT